CSAWDTSLSILF
nr:immunoglobulin light chain junction region [Macaca mulatta]MPO04463.1 immunoglobulin light chain junction region [Macaca mulatta]MPO05080.1 immunoglobulin light chain junction region [Macaca mulatta]MPO05390.1 immunoglobulin light chain junction region [Macaca mulatta]MPO05401.1 immunoglobulin light chain junction region [Macaca mulatta]